MASKTNIRTRDALSALVTQETLRILGALCQDTGQRPIHIFHYLMVRHMSQKKGLWQKLITSEPTQSLPKQFSVLVSTTETMFFWPELELAGKFLQGRDMSKIAQQPYDCLIHRRSTLLSKGSKLKPAPHSLRSGLHVTPPKKNVFLSYLCSSGASQASAYV